MNTSHAEPDFKEAVSDDTLLAGLIRAEGEETISKICVQIQCSSKHVVNKYHQPFTFKHGMQTSVSRGMFSA